MTNLHLRAAIEGIAVGSATVRMNLNHGIARDVVSEPCRPRRTSETLQLRLTSLSTVNTATVATAVIITTTTSISSDPAKFIGTTPSLALTSPSILTPAEARPAFSLTRFSL
ncbi:uncharacterized protein LOC111248114 [Varroa destructor]|uniref:Uncharacterized protein n=1 Tax=Varroa destructor TaxID=109461 RepID=A0A7M7JQN1_VARDE|nr:uncharacterized protein LOC111248114 [Varroa destructor]